jgi:hypothetical protein
MLSPPSLRWPTIVLVIAGAYNLIWSGCMILLPLESFACSGMEQPDKPLHYPQLWQGLGMVIGVFGFGYLLAATDPIRHWGLVLVGLVSKVLGGLGSVSAVVMGQSPPWAILLTLVNDLAWWLPFALILRHVYHTRRKFS